MSEKELLLVNKSIKGDLKAYTWLVKRYEGRLYNFLLKMTKNREDAEDLLQKTFVKAYEKLNTFRGKSSFSTWLFSIALNFYLMKKRVEKDIKLETLDSAIDLEGLAHPQAVVDWDERPDEALDKKEIKEILGKAIDKLPPIYRGVFILKDIEGFSHEEISKMLDISIPAIKTRLLRARLFLRSQLSDYFH